MAARWDLRPAIRQVNDAARQLLAARPGSYFIDTYYAMLGRDGQPVAALFAEDGLHLSTDGYRLWADILRCYRHPLLAR